MISSNLKKVSQTMLNLVAVRKSPIRNKKQTEKSKNGFKENSVTVNKNGANNKSNKSTMGSSKRQRCLPKRACKNRPLSYSFRDNISPNTLQKTIVRAKPKLTMRKKSQRRVTRGAISQLLFKTRKEQPNFYRVNRTVELVDQRTDAFRDEKSKLLFILSLGLTPKKDSDTVTKPVVKLSPADPKVVAEIQNRYAKIKAIKDAEQRKLRRLETNKKSKTNGRASKLSSIEIEVIDLVSDSEDDEKDERSQVVDQLNLSYPHLDVTLLSQANNVRNALSQNKNPIRPLSERVPKLTKRLDKSRRNGRFNPREKLFTKPLGCPYFPKNSADLKIAPVAVYQIQPRVKDSLNRNPQVKVVSLNPRNLKREPPTSP